MEWEKSQGRVAAVIPRVAQKMSPFDNLDGNLSPFTNVVLPHISGNDHWGEKEDEPYNAL